MKSAPTDLLAFAIDVAEQAGRATLAHFQKSIAIEIKNDLSPVTAADREAEQLIRARIAEQFPDDAIFGEEFGESAGRDVSGMRRWIIDPIDGTRSFVHGVPLYGIMLALEVDGALTLGVLHFPALRETVAAEIGAGCWWNGARASVSSVDSLAAALVLTTDRENPLLAANEGFTSLAAAAGMVRTWGDCYGYALVATGRAEVMYDPVVSPWDIAALVPIIREAGGVITDATGCEPWPATSIVATNALLAADVMGILNAHNKTKSVAS